MNALIIRFCLSFSVNDFMVLKSKIQIFNKNKVYSVMSRFEVKSLF